MQSKAEAGLAEEAEVLVASGCRLGESPLWHAASANLYWVDIEGHQLWRWSAAGGASHMVLPGPASFVAEAAEGRLIAGLAQTVVLINPKNGAIRSLFESFVLPETCRFNDGKADRQGRIVTGGAHIGESQQVAPSLRLDGAGVDTLDGLFTVFNGPAFSPDGQRIYFTDSPSKVIRTASYDPETGALGAPEIFTELPASSGYPDGMTVDVEGGLWNAEWDGWQVTRYHPSGQKDRSLALPVPRPTSLTFGGPERDQLYITSARSRLSDQDLAAAPLSGAVFKFRPGERGLPDAVADWARPGKPWRAFNA